MSHTPSLDALPPHIISTILSYLRKSDARALATVCKALRDPAEAVIWRDVDISAPTEWEFEFLIPYDQIQTHTASVAKISMTLQEDTTKLWSIAPGEWDEATFNCFAEGLVRRANEVLSGLVDAHQVKRYLAIRRLRVCLMSRSTFWGPSFLHCLLCRLRVLEVWKITEIHGDLVPTADQMSSLYTSIRSMTALTHLVLHISTPEDKEELCGILASCRTLRSLRLLCATVPTPPEELRQRGLEELEYRHWNDDGDAKELDSAPGVYAPWGLCHTRAWSGPDDPYLDKMRAAKPTITTLEIFHVYTFYSWIRFLIQAADQLKHVRTKDCAMWNEEDRSDEPIGMPRVILDSIRLHQYIQTVNITTYHWDFLCIGGLTRFLAQDGFAAVEELVMFKFGSIAADGFDINRLDVPPLKALRHLVFPVGMRVLLQPGNPPMWGGIDPLRVKQILTAPSLETIQAIDESFLSPAAVRDPAKWCSKRMRGMIIRTYSSNGNVLVHIRRLDLVPPPFQHPYKMPTKSAEFPHKVDDDIERSRREPPTVDTCTEDDTCPKHRWVHFNDFNGQPLPPFMLGYVYNNILGEDISFLTPGRGLSLPRGAWSFLRFWSDKQRVEEARTFFPAVSSNPYPLGGF